MTNDELDASFQNAIYLACPDDDADAARAFASLSSLVAVWRGQANYWCGAANERAETIATLKEQVRWLNEELRRLT